MPSLEPVHRRFQRTEDSVVKRTPSSIMSIGIARPTGGKRGMMGMGMKKRIRRGELRS